jgi:hypothetical protein
MKFFRFIFASVASLGLTFALNEEDKEFESNFRVANFEGLSNNVELFREEELKGNKKKTKKAAKKVKKAAKKAKKAAKKAKKHAKKAKKHAKKAKRLSKKNKKTQNKQKNPYRKFNHAQAYE